MRSAWGEFIRMIFVTTGSQKFQFNRLLQKIDLLIEEGMIAPEDKDLFQIVETAEEACARVRNLSIYTLIDVPHISQVHVFYRAELVDLNFAAGPESLEVKLFGEADIPWSELAFRTVGRTLECYFADRRKQEFPVRSEAVPPMASQ